MRPLIPIVVLGAALLAVLSCAPAPESAAPATPAASETPAPQAVAAASASVVPTDAPPVHERLLELTNGCPKEMHLYYGEHPGDGHGQGATVSAGSTTPIPRGSDGTVVVWVVDDKGFGLASVQVTRRMRHVRVNADCMRIEADSTR
jgi:hypothetical protein